MLVEREPTSRFPIKTQNLVQQFPHRKQMIKDFNLGTKNFANLKVGLLIPDKIAQKSGQLSMFSNFRVSFGRFSILSK